MIPEIRQRKHDIKTREKVQKGRNRPRATDILAGRKLTAKFREELARKPKDGGEAPEVRATDQTEQAVLESTVEVAGAARQGVDTLKHTVQRQRAKQRKRKAEEAKRRTAGAPSVEQSPEPSAPPPVTPEERMKRAAVKERREQAARPKAAPPSYPGAEPSTPPPAWPSDPFPLSTKQRSFSAVSHPSINPSSPASRPGLRDGAVGGAASPKKKKPAPAVKTRQRVWGRASGGVQATSVPQRGRGRGLTLAQERMRKFAQRNLAASRTQRAVKASATAISKVAAAVTRAVAAIISAVAGLAGAAVLLTALAIVILVAAVVSSPFGILFSNEQKAPGAVSPNAAIAQVNVEYAAKLEALQAGDYDSVDIQGQPTDWKQILAVFAAKTAGAEDGVDVATLDPDRVERLRTVFWDMTIVNSQLETISHPGEGDSEGWTERILHITVKARTPDDMRVFYQFGSYQNEALDELLEDLEALGGLLGDLSIIQADAVAILQNLPDGLSPERQAVIHHALSLVGKVNYFWGGKSLTLGWDSRWGATMKVTAEGSSTTGTYRPFGMDCSGYADWVFYNASGGAYIIGHGGGAHAQHTYCTAIDWDEALPGDLVFYPEDTHVGIVGGRDENGNLLIIHCASGANNVVITGLSSFTSIGRPLYYSE